MKEKRQQGKFCSGKTVLNRRFYHICKLITEFVIYAYVASQCRDHTEFRIKAIKIPNAQETVVRWTGWIGCKKLKTPFESAGSPHMPILDIISEQHLLNQKHHRICETPHHICKHLRKKLNILCYLFLKSLLMFLRQPLFSACSWPPE